MRLKAFYDKRAVTKVTHTALSTKTAIYGISKGVAEKPAHKSIPFQMCGAKT
jgi:hypothetical protein